MQPIFSSTCLLGALSLLYVPAVLADDCAAYIDSDFRFHAKQVCTLSYCYGTCLNRYCSLFPGSELDQSQILCVVSNFWVVLGTGILIAILFIAGLISCICKCCCYCCETHQNGGYVMRSISNNVAVTNVVPQQPTYAMTMPPVAYQPVAAYTDIQQPPPPYPGDVGKGPW